MVLEIYEFEVEIIEVINMKDTPHNRHLYES